MNQAGVLLADRYRVERRLGSGAMGVVWLATDERLQRPVAVKQLVAQTDLDPVRSEQARQRAMREGRIAARLHHSNVVAVHDVTEHDGLPVLVMEYLASRSLAEEIVDQGVQDLQVVAGIGAQAAVALAAAHEAGIIHRDVKPANVLLGDDGAVKLTDFGISLAAGDISVTQTGMLNGTPAYLAPEIARGQRPSPASDVFSLGATLYAALEGHPPFGDGSDNSLAVLHEVAAGGVAPAQRAGALSPVLMQMMHDDPVARPTPQQAGEMLRAVAEGRPSAATAHGSPQTGTQPIPVNTGTATAQPAVTRTDTRVAEQPIGGLAARGATSLGATARRHPKALVLLGAALAVLVLALVLLPQRDSPDSAPASLAAPAELERVVSDYYALLPENPDNAWTRLGASLQAQGPGNYKQYWNSVDTVEISDPPRATGNNVHIGVELRMVNGDTIRAFHRLRMGQNARVPLIAADTIVRSETTAPPPAPVVIEPPDPEDEGKGNGAGEDKRNENGRGNDNKGEGNGKKEGNGNDTKGNDG